MIRVVMCSLMAALLLAACGGGGNEGDSEKAKLEGNVRIDGSSTVYPITEAVAEEFRTVSPRVKVSVGVSGTGGGFKKFCVAETDINDASRPIKPSEIEKAAEHKVEFIELPVAFDGISVVVNPKNDFVDHLSVAELRRIWEPGSKVRSWKDVRAQWPDREMKLYAPGVDSGTFDYFTETVNGKSGACRSDFSASEDDNVLVTGIAGDQYALGFFGFAYFDHNRDKLKIVAIDGSKGPIEPSNKTINDGTYSPLSRPIFIYVSAEAAKRPEVDAFVNFYLKSAAALVKDVGYVPLPEKVYEFAIARFGSRRTGTVYKSESDKSRTLAELMAP